MKSRFTILDVAAMATELQPLVGLRLANLYDTASAKTFLLKFAKTDVKTLVLVESGVRVHTTAYARERDKDLKMPSHFIAKLRKHLKTRRLVAVKQLGADRILHLAFESYHLFVELYSSGNIILTDAEFVILAVLRVVDVETNAISAAITEPIAPTPTTADPTPADAAPQTAHDKVEINFRIGQRYTMVDFEKPYVSQDPRPAIEKAIAEFKLTLSKPVAPVEAPIEIVADEVETAAPATSKKGGKKAAATQKKKDKRMQKEATASKDSSITLRKWAKERFSASYGPALVDHAVSFERAKHRKLQNETAEGNSSAKFAIDPSLKMRDIVDDLELERVVVEGLVSGFCDANRILELIFSGSLKCEGWVTQIEHKNPSTGLASEEAAKDALITYDEFHPYLFAHLDTSESSTQMKHFTSFATCVDEFFTHAESQRLQLRLHQAETSATKKIENMSKNHAAQVNRLQTTCVASAAVAATIEYHLETVEAVIATVRTCVARGMDWVELWDLIKEEKRAGNHVAAVIDGLRLDVGMVTVSLMDASYEEEESDDDDSDEDDDDISSDDDGDNAADASSKRAALGKKKAELAKKRKEAEERRRAAMVKIDLDIYLSAYANARRYYDSKKVAAVKAEKTISAVSKALKQAEKKINQELKATQNSAPLIRTIRTQYWFEKFIWFVTSENYLVVAGRDPAQTDLLLRRYMKKDDVCVSADVEGAPIALVLNSFSSRGTQSASQQGSAPPGLTKEAPIPPLTLHQAGTLCVVHSRAWEAKIVTSAWWVRGETVMMHGGVAPILKGEKNYLPPVQLIYGFGLLFLVDEASAARHYDDRRPWARLGGVSNIVEEDGTQVADIADEEVGEVSGENDSESDSDTAEKHAEEKSDEPAVNFDKYNLAKPSPAAEANIDPVVDDGHEKGGDEDQDEASSKRPAVKGAKKRISAKERRQMKKGGKPEEPVSSTTPTATGISEPSHAVSEHEDETDEETEEHASISLMKSGAKSPASIASKESGAKSVASSVKPLPRGKKAKLKKMKDKYADQSDEEKEVMMTLLHGSDKKDEKEKEKQKDSDAHKKGGQQKQAGGKGNLNHPKPAGHKPKANVVGSLEFKGDAEDVDLSVLDALTSQPLTDDVLLACIPVCAPWTCLSKYKYKIKLIPGSLKKGKAAKSAESTFKTMMAKNGDKRETDVLVNIPETEYIAAILGKVKMTGAAGGNDGKKKT